MDPQKRQDPGALRTVDVDGTTYYEKDGSFVPIEDFAGDATPDYSGYSPALQGALQEYKRGELSKDLGIGVGLQAAESAGLLIPTAMDRHSKAGLKELERMRDAGQLGLTGDERTLLERGAMAPVQAMAAENRMRDEARAASMGGTASVADLTRAAREADRGVAEQARMAGLSIEEAHLRRKAEQLRELEEKKVALGERQKEMLKAASMIPAGIAGDMGKVRAARAVPMPNIDALKANDWSDDDIVILLNEISQASRLPPALRAGYVKRMPEGPQKDYLETMLTHGSVPVKE